MFVCSFADPPACRLPGRELQKTLDAQGIEIVKSQSEENVRGRMVLAERTKVRFTLS